MKDGFNDMVNDFQKAQHKIEQFINDDLPIIMGVEALGFVAENFQQEGFQGTNGVQKWEKRKVTDKKGNDKRYYRRRKGKQGKLTKFGETEKGRAILVGHNNGDGLHKTFYYEVGKGFVDIENDKPYAERHNEGLEGMPERRMIGPSPVLDAKAKKYNEQHLDKIMP